MKRNAYGFAVTAVSVLMVAVIILQEFGISSFANLFKKGADSSKADYTYGDYVGYVSPKSTSVTDGKSAQAAAAEIFGVDESSLSVTMEYDFNSDESFYKLQQVSDGIPIWGRSVNLSVDGGKVYLASGGLSTESISVSTTDPIDEEWIEISVRSYVIDTFFDGEEPEDLSIDISPIDDECLCIYNMGEYENDPHLAYDGTFAYYTDEDEYQSGSYDVLIDAHNGDVLRATSNVYYSPSAVEYSYLGKNYHADIEKEGSEYIFYDDSRNITLYDAKSTEVSPPLNNEVSYDKTDHLDFSGYSVFTVTDDLDDWEDNDIHALILLSNVQKCYDFYDEILGRKGFNNNNGEMSVFLNHKKAGTYTAYSCGLKNATWLAFIDEFNVRKLDVVGHEFTHSVERSISQMTYRGQSAAIMEGYSDTFGILIEEYANGSSDWKCDYSDARDAPLNFGDEHLTNSTEAQEEDDSWKYEYLYVVSNRAYSIWTGWDGLSQTYSHSEKLTDIAHLFYRALFLLESCSGFSDWFWAMKQVAGYMLDKGELTQEQYDVVMNQFSGDSEIKSVEEDNFDPLRAIAVLVAQSGETSLTDEIKELASAPVIPKIKESLCARALMDTGTEVDYEYWNDGEKSKIAVMIKKEAIFYYMAALYGEDYATEFVSDISSSQLYRDYDETYYMAECEPEAQIRRSWSWEITETAHIDDKNIMYFATMESPKGVLYDVRFMLTYNESYSGAFFNGYYLNTMTVTPVDDDPGANDKALLDWLDSLVKQCGVVEVGTEEYYSESGGFETVVPYSRIAGLLAADLDDYDGDGENELFVVRIDPESYYTTGKTEKTGTTYVMLEMYEVAKGGVSVCTRTFPIIALVETEYQISAHIFKTADESGIKIYFDHFFNFNSQTFALIQMEYDGNALDITDGVELDEYAYSIECYRAVSDSAESTILGRQSFDMGSDGWDDVAGNYWDWNFDTYDEEEFNSLVKYTLNTYDDLLNGMGIKETASRAMYAGYNETTAGLQKNYYRCCLRPTEHYVCTSGKLSTVCSIMAPYGQGSVTFTAEDETVLLYQYRNGKSGSSSYAENGTDSSYEQTSGGYDSVNDVFFAFTDALKIQSAEGIVALYSEKQLSYAADEQGCEVSDIKEQIAKSWNASWGSMTDSSTWQYNLTNITYLDSDEISERFGNHPVKPEQAAKLHITADSVTDKVFIIYAACYDGKWYLSVANN